MARNNTTPLCAEIKPREYLNRCSRRYLSEFIYSLYRIPNARTSPPWGYFSLFARVFSAGRVSTDALLPGVLQHHVFYLHQPNLGAALILIQLH